MLSRSVVLVLPLTLDLYGRLLRFVGPYFDEEVVTGGGEEGRPGGVPSHAVHVAVVGLGHLHVEEQGPALGRRRRCQWRPRPLHRLREAASVAEDANVVVGAARRNRAVPVLVLVPVLLLLLLRPSRPSDP